MLGGDDEDDTPTAAAPSAAPVETPDAPSPAATAIAEAVPLPVARPTEVASTGPQLATAYAPQQLPSGPDMVWRSGPDASAGRASTSYEVPATTPGAVAMPVPRPSDTTPAALVAGNAPKRNVINPAVGAPVTASLMPGGKLTDERTLALRMLNSLGESAPQPAPQTRTIAAIDHIAAAHEAFAPQPPATTTPIAAAAPTASLSPQRTARDRSVVLSHPNLKRTAMAAPANVLPLNFGGNPNSGMRSDAFVGSSIAVLRTMTFGLQRTAELGKPRG